MWEEYQSRRVYLIDWPGVSVTMFLRIFSTISYFPFFIVIPYRFAIARRSAIRRSCNFIWDTSYISKWALGSWVPEESEWLIEDEGIKAWARTGSGHIEEIQVLRAVVLSIITSSSYAKSRTAPPMLLVADQEWYTSTWWYLLRTYGSYVIYTRNETHTIRRIAPQ